MSPEIREEVWFARVVVILGAVKLVFALTDLFAILKAHSHLPIVNAPGSENFITVAYLITSGLVALYLLSGGRLLSFIAYNRPAPRNLLFTDIPFPVGSGWLAVALRSFGAWQFIQGVNAIGLVVAYRFYAEPAGGHSVGLNWPSPAIVESANILEHFILAALLLWLGGHIATFFVGPGKHGQPAKDTSAPDAGE